MKRASIVPTPLQPVRMIGATRAMSTVHVMKVPAASSHLFVSKTVPIWSRLTFSEAANFAPSVIRAGSPPSAAENAPLIASGFMAMTAWRACAVLPSAIRRAMSPYLDWLALMAFIDAV